MKALSTQRPIVLGIMLMVGFSIFGPTIDVFAKLAGPEIPIFQVAACRFLIQMLLLVPLAALLGKLHRPNVHEIYLHLVRAALIVLATACFFAALKYMPIAEAISIFFIEPLLLTLLSGWLLKESIGWRRIAACCVGFCGALLVIQPQFETLGWVAFFPLGTAACFCFYLILTRQMAQRMDPITLQGYTAIAATVLVVPVLLVMNNRGVDALDTVIPQGPYWFYLLGVGICATIAHLFISFAFRFAPASVLAPLQYLEIVSATLFGYWVFGDLPNALTFVGVAIIIASGLFVFWREQKAATITHAS